MDLTTNDFASRELSAGELETVAAGFSFFDRIRAELLKDVQLILGSKSHPPLPGGGPAPWGGPHRV